MKGIIALLIFAALALPALAAGDAAAPPTSPALAAFQAKVAAVDAKVEALRALLAGPEDKRPAAPQKLAQIRDLRTELADLAPQAKALASMADVEAALRSLESAWQGLNKVEELALSRLGPGAPKKGGQESLDDLYELSKFSRFDFKLTVLRQDIAAQLAASQGRLQLAGNRSPTNSRTRGAVVLTELGQDDRAPVLDRRGFTAALTPGLTPPGRKDEKGGSGLRVLAPGSLGQEAPLTQETAAARIRGLKDELTRLDNDAKGLSAPPDVKEALQTMVQSRTSELLMMEAFFFGYKGGDRRGLPPFILDTPSGLLGLQEGFLVGPGKKPGFADSFNRLGVVFDASNSRPDEQWWNPDAPSKRAGAAQQLLLTQRHLRVSGSPAAPLLLELPKTESPFLVSLDTQFWTPGAIADGSLAREFTQALLRVRERQAEKERRNIEDAIGKGADRLLALQENNGCWGVTFHGGQNVLNSRHTQMPITLMALRALNVANKELPAEKRRKAMDFVRSVIPMTFEGLSASEKTWSFEPYALAYGLSALVDQAARQRGEERKRTDALIQNLLTRINSRRMGYLGQHDYGSTFQLGLVAESLLKAQKAGYNLPQASAGLADNLAGDDRYTKKRLSDMTRTDPEIQRRLDGLWALAALPGSGFVADAAGAASKQLQEENVRRHSALNGILKTLEQSRGAHGGFAYRGGDRYSYGAPGAGGAPKDFAGEGGSAGRSVLAEYVLYEAGRVRDAEGKPSDRRLKLAVDRFMKYRPDMARVLENVPLQTHDTSTSNAYAKYYFYFGTYWTARALEALPQDEARPIAGKLAAAILKEQKPDGTWVDSPEYAGASYGTATVIQALDILKKIIAEK